MITSIDLALQQLREIFVLLFAIYFLKAKVLVIFLIVYIYLSSGLLERINDYIRSITSLSTVKDSSFQHSNFPNLVLKMGKVINMRNN